MIFRDKESKATEKSAEEINNNPTVVDSVRFESEGSSTRSSRYGITGSTISLLLFDNPGYMSVIA